MPTLSLQRPLDQPEGRYRLIDDLRSGLQSPGFESLKIAVAYAKVAPLEKLRGDLEGWKEEGKSLEAVFGVDQQGTSLEALRFCLDLFDSVWVFHQYGLSFTFHPKLYLFQGQNESLAYVGSNNLTTGGTETNFECGLKLDLRLSQDEELIREIEEAWEETRKHSRELDDELLASLQEAGFVVSEQVTRARITKSGGSGSDGDQERPSFSQIDVQPASPAPKEPKVTEGEIVGVADTTTPEPATSPDKVESANALAWRKRNLKSRDAQRPGEGTNPSGVITLVQDFFTDDEGNRIDKTTYFRHDVFGGLNWWEEDDKEVTEANFRIWIEDKYHSTSALRISHKIEWEAGQDNYTTAIHWGPLNSILREQIDIRGWNFYLYETAVQGQWEIQLVPPED